MWIHAGQVIGSSETPIISFSTLTIFLDFCLIGKQTFGVRWQEGWDARLLGFHWSSTLALSHPVIALHLHGANRRLQSGRLHCQCQRDRRKSLSMHTHMATGGPTVWTEAPFLVGFISHCSVFEIHMKSTKPTMSHNSRCLMIIRDKQEYNFGKKKKTTRASSNVNIHVLIRRNNLCLMIRFSLLNSLAYWM